MKLKLITSSIRTHIANTSQPSISNKYWNKIKINKKKIIQLFATNIVNNKFIAIIEILTNYNMKIMQQCYFEICCISKMYPPQKNENKFIYGKLVEKSLIHAFCSCGFLCEDLDEKHTDGSEYKNDIKLLQTKFSIKTKLNKGGDIIMINKKSSTYQHTINIDTILCIINEQKIYFIPNNIVNKKTHVKEDAGSFSYKGTLITTINNKYKEYIYYFPELSDLQKTKLIEITEIHIYTKLYNEILKL
jgi:hypothetical protein